MAAFDLARGKQFLGPERNAPDRGTRSMEGV